MPHWKQWEETLPQIETDHYNRHNFDIQKKWARIQRCRYTQLQGGSCQKISKCQKVEEQDLSPPLGQLWEEALPQFATDHYNRHSFDIQRRWARIQRCRHTHLQEGLCLNLLSCVRGRDLLVLLGRRGNFGNQMPVVHSQRCSCTQQGPHT